MAYTVMRELSYQPRPMSHTLRNSLYAELDEYYLTHKRLERGAFTDLCERYKVHPLDMRRVMDAYSKRKFKMKHGCSRRRLQYWGGRLPQPDVLDTVKPFGGWNGK